MIEDSLQNRAHVVDYDTEVIPTKQEIEEILQTAYPLVTSKQKAYPYKCYVIGPDPVRSKKLWRLTEGDKIRIDEDAFGASDESYSQNPGLFHMASAPWTLIFTPRVAPPNPHYLDDFTRTKSKWQLGDADYVNCGGQRQATSIEVGMLAKAITGAAMDRGWNSSYNICFPEDVNLYKPFLPFIDYEPLLMQTIGKGKNYLWQRLTPEKRILNTDPPFEDIFKFVDGE